MTWAFDESAFVADVLTPVQAGWPPERDRFRVYQLPLDSDDSATVDAALEGVRRRLSSPRFRGYRRACELLRSQHEAAAAVLTDPERREAHRRAVRAEFDKLKTSLEHRLNGAPGLPPQEVADLARDSRGMHTASAIRAALAELNASEREPVTLPTATAPTQWPELRARLVQLGFDTLWDYLTTTLAGLATTRGQIAERRALLRVSRDESAAAETTVLKLVEQWMSDGLTTVLRYELLNALEPEAGYGYRELERTVGKVTARLKALELPPDPATVAYAVWTAARSAAEQKVTWEDSYQAAIRDRHLRAARDVLTAQPKLSAEWQHTLDALTTRLAALDGDLDRAKALERTDTDAAVELYHHVRAQWDDPAIDAALSRCRPSPPPQVTATVTKQRVTVTWQPSPSRAGRISYLVHREDEEIASDITGLEYVDQDPAGGIPLTYSVFAVRDGVASAQAGASRPVTVLRDVHQLELESGPDAITGRWTLPPGASGVSVTRTGDGSSQTLPGAHSTGFVDRTVESGRGYTYRVRAEYRRPNGSVVYADGVVATAARQELPTPVTDLRVELDQGELVLRWTPPGTGEVRILDVAETPDSNVMPVRTAMRHGSSLSTTGSATMGQARAAISGERRKYVLVPVTVVGELAAVGTACEVDTRQSAVTSLRADRFGPTVRLTWQWPAGVTEARVMWRTGQAPSGPTDPDAVATGVTRAAYESRGVHLTVPAGDHWFGVCTSVIDGEQTRYGPLSLVRESAVTEVRYSVRRPRLRFTGARELVIDSADPPPVVLVAKSGTRPMNANDGEQVVRLAAGAQVARVEFTLPSGLRRPVHLRAFSLDDRVVLVPAHVSQLTIS